MIFGELEVGEHFFHPKINRWMYKTEKQQFKKDNTIYNAVSAIDMYYIDYQEEVIRNMRTNIEAADEILDLYFPVLDHGFVALKDYMGGDESIELAARTSYGRGTRKQSDTETLIRYLYRNRHTTPFEMTELTFHIGMPIFVARQYFRHRTFNFNEYSGRYSEIPDIFYTPELSRITKQSKDNKQGSSDELVYDNEGYESFLANRSCGPTFQEYKDRLEDGWAKELARIDLPLSTYTYFYCKVDLHNLLHFLKLRTDSHAQKEIRDFADVIAGMTKRVAPLAYQAWIDYAYCAKLFTRLDILFLQWCTENLGHCPVEEWSYNYMCMHSKKHEEIGMGKREVEEFFTKINPVAVPNFELDITKGKRKDV